MAALLSQILTSQVRPWWRPWLALALTAAFITAAPAQVVPPHLVSMSADLLRGMKDQLQTPPRDVGPPQVVKRTNDLLEQEMLSRWGRGSLALAGVVPKIASTLGVPRVTPENLPTLQRFLDTWSQGETDQALREFYQATGRQLPSSVEREALSKKLSEVVCADQAASARRHTIQGRNPGQSITLEWQPEKFRFSMQVEDDGSGGTEPFRTTIDSKVKARVSRDGQDLQLQVMPEADPCTYLDAQDLERLYLSILGKWQDQEGLTWLITSAAAPAPERTPEKTLAPETTGARRPIPEHSGRSLQLEKIRHDGSIQDWPGARYSILGSLQAQGVYDDVRDLKPELPTRVKEQVVASRQAPRRLDLAVIYDQATGDVRLEGQYLSHHVTYSPDALQMKSIHTPFQLPLVLTRPRVQSLRFIEATAPYATLTILDLGKPFRVEVRYAADPGCRHTLVTLHNRDNRARLLLLAEGTENPRIFRTGPVTLVPEVQL